MSPKPEIPANEQPTMLASFEYRLTFSPPGVMPPDEWLEGSEDFESEGVKDGFEAFYASQLWRQRSALRYLVAEEIGQRLDLRYNGLVSPKVEVRRGSLLVAVTLMLASGISLASFIYEFSDFIIGLGQLKAALGEDVVHAATRLSTLENLDGLPEIRATGVTRSVNWPEPASAPKSSTLPEPIPQSEAPLPSHDPPLRSIFGPPRVSNLKLILRVLVLVLGFFWLLSEFQVTRDLLSGFVNVPDLRYQTVYLLDFRATTAGPSEQLLFKVSNQGIGSVRGVLARLHLEDAAIQEYQVLSDELYRVESSDLPAGKLDLWLERLASGTKLQLYVVTDRPVNNEQVQFSTVGEQGMGRARPASYFRGSLEDYRNQALIEAAQPTEFILWARQAGLAQFWEDKYLPWVTLISAGLIFLLWLFVDGLMALVAGLFLTFLVTWIFVDANLPASTFIFILTLSLMFVLWTSFQEFTPLDRDIKHFVFWVIEKSGYYLYIILAVLLAGLAFAILISIGKRVPLHWLVAVLGGLVIYYLIGLGLEDLHRKGRKLFR